MSSHKCDLLVRAVVIAEEMHPPDAISGSFPGWDAWEAGGKDRKRLVEFVARHLEICANPENLNEPELVESPGDSDMFPMSLDSVSDGEAVLAAKVPFVFTRKVKASDLDPESEFSDEYGSISGIFSIHWKVGEGEYEEGFQDSENFTVSLAKPGK
jgi:hypothetical protein